MENSTNNRSKFYQLRNQLIACLGVFLLILQNGMSGGWTSPNLARLTRPDSPIPLTQDQGSWLASLPSLGSLFGAVLASVMNGWIGNRRTMIFTLILLSVSWIMLLFATSIEHLFIARFLSGMALGTTFSTFVLYLGEVSSPEYRGTFICIAAIGSSIGTTICSALEAYLPMKVSTSIYLGEGVIAFLVFLWLEDSPYYLVKKKNMENAEKAILFYDRCSDVNKKLEDIKSFVEASESVTIKDQVRELANPVVRKSLILVITIILLTYMAGSTVVFGYMEIILTKGKSTLVDPKEFVIYLNITGIVTSALTFNLLDKLGRRKIYIGGSFLAALAMILLSVHFLLLTLEFDPKPIQIIPPFSIVLYIFAFSCGLSATPFALTSEIFPSNIKNAAAGVASLTMALAGFLTTVMYQPVVNLAGESCAFGMFAGFLFLSILIAILFMPETKGKTFLEIQEILGGKKKEVVSTF